MSVKTIGQGRATPNNGKSPSERVSPTAAMLAKQFGGRVVVPLADVCPLLGMEPSEAQRKHNAGELPFAAFRMRDSNKAPVLVHVRELASYIDAKSLRAKDQVRSAWV